MKQCWNCRRVNKRNVVDAIVGRCRTGFEVMRGATTPTTSKENGNSTGRRLLQHCTRRGRTKSPALRAGRRDDEHAGTAVTCGRRFTTLHYFFFCCLHGRVPTASSARSVQNRNFAITPAGETDVRVRGNLKNRRFEKPRRDRTDKPPKPSRDADGD